MGNYRDYMGHDTDNRDELIIWRVSIAMGVPQKNGWFRSENPMKMRMMTGGSPSHGNLETSVMHVDDTTRTWLDKTFLLQHIWHMSTGWWFGTFFIFPHIWNNHPNWLIFFRGVQTTNQSICTYACAHAYMKVVHICSTATSVERQNVTLLWMVGNESLGQWPAPTHIFFGVFQWIWMCHWSSIHGIVVS